MTHTGEILSEIKKSKIVEIENAQYTIDGVKAIIIDPFDGQKYELTIKPIENALNPQRN